MTANADLGARETTGAPHYQSCNHALCPCYLDGLLRAGIKPTGRALLGALEEAATLPGTPPPNDGSQAPAQLITDHGFMWLGQSWSTCDECGQPADQHVGMDVPCREHVFCDCPSTIRPWAEK